MILVLPFFSGDVKQAHNLLVWISDLGGCKNHACVLVADADTDWQDGRKAFELAKPSFASVKCISNGKGVQGWIAGSCSLFRAAAEYCAGQPFLFLEPDAVPLRAGWMDEIAAAYAAYGKSFMGTLVEHANPGLPNPYMEGCGVYPADCWERMKNVWTTAQSWCYSAAKLVIPNAVHTPLIHHIWGETDNPPTFADQNRPGTNVFCLAQLRPDAVLFHRNKDGSLIRLLRRRLGINHDPDTVPITPFFAFCGKDQALMAKSLAWISEMQPKLARRAVLHFDDTIKRGFQGIVDSAKRAFDTVLTSQYQRPRHPWVGWPAACNWSFQRACDFVRNKIQGPFMWFEADAVAIVPDWLEQIELEYAVGGKPFMGTRIGDFDGMKMGHINGTSVYPADAPRYFPKALANPKYPWDAGMRDEMIQHAHFSNRIMQHCGAVVNGKCKPANGNYATFPNQETVDRLLDPEVVFFHPCKDGTLIDRLRERQHGQVR